MIMMILILLIANFGSPLQLRLLTVEPPLSEHLCPLLHAVQISEMFA